MQRNYEYNSSTYYNGEPRYSSTDEYLERITRMQRTPTIITDFPHFPNVHEVLKNKSTSYADKKEDNWKKTSHKKVQIVEDEKTTEDGVRNNGSADEPIDVEAGGLIQQKHKNFGLCKWGTFNFKAY